MGRGDAQAHIYYSTTSLITFDNNLIVKYQYMFLLLLFTKYMHEKEKVNI